MPNEQFLKVFRWCRKFSKLYWRAQWPKLFCWN